MLNALWHHILNNVHALLVLLECPTKNVSEYQYHVALTQIASTGLLVKTLCVYQNVVPTKSVLLTKNAYEETACVSSEKIYYP
jgi:hypothetical protein